MVPRLIPYFFRSASVLLIITGAAKIISGFGSAKILDQSDPVFGFSMRDLFWIVGIMEAGVALACAFCRSIGLRAALVAWLASSFVLYRLALIWVGYQKPCSCLGNLTDALHISPQAADIGLKVVLAYFLVGGYGTLAWLWMRADSSQRGNVAEAPIPAGS